MSFRMLPCKSEYITVVKQTNKLPFLLLSTKDKGQPQDAGTWKHEIINYKVDSTSYIYLILKQFFSISPDDSW